MSKLRLLSALWAQRSSHAADISGLPDVSDVADLPDVADVADVDVLHGFDRQARMSLIWTPTGAMNTERPEVFWPIEFMRMLAIFARNCEDIKLGLRCENCRQPLQGHNAREDNFWHMECHCRTYVGSNPLPKTVV